LSQCGFIPFSILVTHADSIVVFFDLQVSTKQPPPALAFAATVDARAERKTKGMREDSGQGRILLSDPISEDQRRSAVLQADSGLVIGRGILSSSTSA
jgi:hypothetical protein